MMKSNDLQVLESHYRNLIAAQLSLQLATVNSDGTAEISYAPFLEDKNRFYIFVSTLAKHTGNLLRNKQAAIMFIQPELDAPNPFARQRLVLQCRVTEIPKAHESYPLLLDGMQSRQGDIVGLLRTLQDFHLLALAPQSGQFIAGFGKAFTVDIDSGELHAVVS